MSDILTSSFFKGNRERLKALLKIDIPIVLTANGLLQRGADSPYTFTQDANFWYLTGLNEPDLTLVIDGDQEYIIIPERSARRMAFDGKLDRGELIRRSAIKNMYDGQEGWNKLKTKLKKVNRLATLALPPAYIEDYGLYTNPARGTILEQIKSYNRSLKLLDIYPQMAKMRMIKQKPEIKAIESAINITIDSFNEATHLDKLAKYAYEYELEAAITSGFKKRGALEQAFMPIIAGGKRAVTLHNVSNNSKLESHEMVIVDIGAEVEHYAADITRTIGLKKVSDRQRSVHEAVEDVQRQAFGLLKPGVVLKEYEEKVRDLLGEKLMGLGLIKTKSLKNIRHYYPHSTSHFVGLNVHDVGDYEKPLEPGVVLTVEPGIYIPEEGIGVRIEDDILITEAGNKILSNKLSRRLG